MSLAPIPQPIGFEQGDKLEHFAAYGLLMALFGLAYVSRGARFAYAAGFILMGIALEFLQGMTDYRTFDVFDMLANTIGVALGWAAGWFFSRHVRIHR